MYTDDQGEDQELYNEAAASHILANRARGETEVDDSMEDEFAALCQSWYIPYYPPKYRPSKYEIVNGQVTKKGV
jgi:hypothetical protein